MADPDTTDCSPGCRNCAAMNLLYAAAAALETAGDTAAADHASALAERAGRKDATGNRLARVLVGEMPDRCGLNLGMGRFCTEPVADGASSCLPHLQQEIARLRALLAGTDG